MKAFTAPKYQKYTLKAREKICFHNTENPGLKKKDFMAIKRNNLTLIPKLELCLVRFQLLKLTSKYFAKTIKAFKTPKYQKIP